MRGLQPVEPPPQGSNSDSVIKKFWKRITGKIWEFEVSFSPIFKFLYQHGHELIEPPPRPAAGCGGRLQSRTQILHFNGYRCTVT